MKYIVTSVRKGKIYIRPQDTKRTAEWVSPDRWEKVFGQLDE